MSRTKKGGKAPNEELWSKRGFCGWKNCKFVKQKTHRIERQQNKPKPKDFQE
jgi:hypothetical protein